MAKCARCGVSLGFLSFAKMCEDCSAHVQAEQQARAAAQTENERRARAEMVVAQAQDMRTRIENGGCVMLYEDIYLPVDSQIVDEAINKDFSIGSLRKISFND